MEHVDIYIVGRKSHMLRSWTGYGMAYRRVSRRLGTSRRKYTRKRSYRRLPTRRPAPSRKGFRKGKFGGIRHPLKGSNPGKLARRAISNVAATKKSNTLLFGRADDEPILGSLTLDQNQYFYIWAPTYLERWSGVDTGHTRNRKEVFWRGVSEKWFVRTEDVPWTHRRVIFYHPSIIPQAAPFYAASSTTDGIPTTIRPMGGRSRLEFANSDDASVLRTFFEGSEGRDWTQQMAWNAKFDGKRNRVISDTRRTYNPGNDTGRMGVFKTWVELNTPCIYADQEFGDSVVGVDTTAPPPRLTGWTDLSARNSGQLYFLDIFSRGPEEIDSGTMFVTNQATQYWHEK